MSPGRHGARAALVAVAVLLAVPAAAGAGQPIGGGEGGVRLNRLAGDYERPVHIAGAPGFPRLLFVVEQVGRIQVLHRGRRLARPFLDISDRVGGGDNEQGLLSVAFAPDYERSRRFYVYYTDREGSIRVDEFRRSPADPSLALPESRRPLLAIPHPQFANHNGGQLQFQGPLLYLGTGDGGSGGDPPNNAQNTNSLLGKILRIDPRPAGGRPYSVPGSNPFVGRPGRDEVFSYGLRNPFRFSIQPLARAPDRILIGDVGQSRFEEIDYETLPEASGANFGWDAWEGFARYDCGAPTCRNGDTPDPGRTIFPILVYGRDRGCAVTGGYVVRDRSLVSLYRRYVYADYCRGELRSFVPRLAGAADDKPVGPPLPEVSSFGQTPDGRLFVSSLGGGVYRIAAEE